ncbi:hypothetical protein MYCTH_2298893, partial [Thermothelomyces thermophilus ATCC 42464]
MSHRQAVQLGKRACLPLGVFCLPSSSGLVDLLLPASFCGGGLAVAALGPWFVRERKGCHNGQDKLHVLGSGSDGGGGGSGGSGGGGSVMRI